MIPGTLLVVAALAVAALSNVAEAFKGKCGQQNASKPNHHEMTPPAICTTATATATATLRIKRQSCASSRRK